MSKISNKDFSLSPGLDISAEAVQPAVVSPAADLDPTSTVGVDGDRYTLFLAESDEDKNYHLAYNKNTSGKVLCGKLAEGMTKVKGTTLDIGLQDFLDDNNLEGCCEPCRQRGIRVESAGRLVD